MSNAIAATPNEVVVRPGRFLDWYPEASIEDEDCFERKLAELEVATRGARLCFTKFATTAEEIERKVSDLDALSESGYRRSVIDVRIALKSRGFIDENVVQVFALVGVAVRREFGFAIHAEQYFCGWLLLQGMLAEMATGEGKSISAALAATAAALAGTPVHVITTNDYLVERDATAMRPIFAKFGLTCSAISMGQSDDSRRAAYAEPICYVSNKQLVFDYLRDRQQIGTRPSSISARVQPLFRDRPVEPILRGLCFAIVDEADSVLVDDAMTPLILSRQLDGKRDVIQSLTAISLARRLDGEDDFSVDSRARRVTLTEQGDEKLAALASGLEGIWKNRRFRLELVRQALMAIYLYHRDRDYLVRDGHVILIDQSTGRVMPDRKLQNGLHQMVESKERCEVTGQTETIASLSFQEFFRRYRHLCGMTGTARQAASELRRVYRLGVVSVPTHHPTARETEPPRFGVDDAQYQALLLAEIDACRVVGRPVLIGTRTLAHSERISAFLKGVGLRHRVLNARQDKEEADVIAEAGRKGAVTVATNMAGRGTDIPIGAQVRKLGGLRVIVAEVNESRRIDRQLIGRCARQGDPGSFIYIISLDDEMLIQHAPTGFVRALRSRLIRSMPFWGRLCLLLCRCVQMINERDRRNLRAQVAVSDAELRRRLSFSGYKE